MRTPIIILLFAFCLRLIALNARPVWYDEAFAVFLAEKDYAAIAFGTAADTMPPLYYIFLHGWISLVGETPFALRMLSVALSMLTVVLVFAIARRGFGVRVATFAAFFTALAPFHIYHAQELRMYTTLAVALLVYMYAVMRLIAHQRYVLPLLGLATGMALYSHNLAFLTLGAANIFLLWRRDWSAQFRLIIAQIVGVFLFFPWLLYVPTQIAKIQRAFWTQPPGLADVLQMLVVFTTHLPLPPVVFALALFITLAIFALATLELGRAFRRGAPPALGLVLAFALIPPVLMFALSYVMRPIFVPRGAIVSSLAYYILLAYLVARAARGAADNRRIHRAADLAVLLYRLGRVATRAVRGGESVFARLCAGGRFDFVRQQTLVLSDAFLRPHLATRISCRSAGFEQRYARAWLARGAGFVPD